MYKNFIQSSVLKVTLSSSYTMSFPLQTMLLHVGSDLYSLQFYVVYDLIEDFTELQGLIHFL